MDDLKINNIKQKYINTKEKFTYFFGLLVDDNLKKYAEDREINSLFEIDSTLDMLNISISSAITNIEIFDNIGLMSNNIMDNNSNNIMDYSNDSVESTYSDFKTSTKSFFSNNSFDNNNISKNFNLDSKEDKEDIKNNENKEDIKNNENKEDKYEEQIFNYMSTFASSLGSRQSMPKVLLPMILYTYMKLDPESILNKEKKEYTEQIPINGEHNVNIFNNKNAQDINVNKSFSDEYTDEYNYSDEYTDDSESITGSGVEDLD